MSYAWTKTDVKEVVKGPLKDRVKQYVNMKYVKFDELLDDVVDKFIKCCGYSFKEFRKKNRKTLKYIVKEFTDDDVRAAKNDCSLFREYCYETVIWKEQVYVARIFFKDEYPDGFCDGLDQFTILDDLCKYKFWESLRNYIVKKYESK